jgi:dGTPase
MEPRRRTEQIEAASLVDWATLVTATRGRERAEDADPLRTDFQRDRDRILHTKSFRRLKHKTQVFLAPEGDHYRTRLTHTLEVTQVARTICRAVGLNEDLVEAICLGHDVGHTPFGHAGEEALGKAMGISFEHNRQSLRVVDVLDDLNLTWEVRDGILNHTWRMPEPSTPEALVARWSDRIAYINHDLDDAMRAGILTPDDLPATASSVLGDSYRDRVNAMVRGIVWASIEAGGVVMPRDVAEAMTELRTFLFDRVYLGPAKTEAEKGARVLEMLCEYFREHSEELPDRRPQDDIDQRVVDYVSGMTDRFALRVYEDRFVPKGFR